MRVTIAARAKINLDLRVLERRADGYHELQTIFQELELHDTVSVERAPGPFRLAGEPGRMPLDRSNLAWRAAAALWRVAGRPGEPEGARIRIRKRIPLQAGLGGGSTDAAAALLGLNRVWRLALTRPALAAVGAEIGADIPFFLIGGAAMGLERGEALYPLVDLPPTPVVLVVPPFGVPTGDAYEWLAEERARASQLPAPVPAPGRAGWLTLGTCQNDFEAVVERRHPEIRTLREALSHHGARLARLSGSGSAVFGLFGSSRQAALAARHLAGDGRTVFRTRTSPRRASARRGWSA